MQVIFRLLAGLQCPPESDPAQILQIYLILILIYSPLQFLFEHRPLSNACTCFYVFLSLPRMTPPPSSYLNLTRFLQVLLEIPIFYDPFSVLHWYSSSLEFYWMSDDLKLIRAQPLHLVHHFTSVISTRFFFSTTAGIYIIFFFHLTISVSPWPSDGDIL